MIGLIGAKEKELDEVVGSLITDIGNGIAQRILDLFEIHKLEELHRVESPGPLTTFEAWLPDQFRYGDYEVENPFISELTLYRYMGNLDSLDRAEAGKKPQLW